MVSYHILDYVPPKGKGSPPSTDPLPDPIQTLPPGTWYFCPICSSPSLLSSPGVALCLWTQCRSFSTIALFTIVAGFFNGGCVTCYPALAADIFPPEQLGGAISLIYTYVCAPDA